jgi:hypothetical protein
MTVINTSYTTLEDAWGPNFDTDHNNKQKKKKKVKTDPLCELYGRRYKKHKKPYGGGTGSNKSQTYRSFAEDDDVLYYGYDDELFTRNVNSERKKSHLLTLDEDDDQCIDLSSRSKDNKNNKTPNKKKKKKVRFEVTPEDEDDVYLQQAVNNEVDEIEFDDMIQMDNKKAFEKIYTNVYAETDDEVDQEMDIYAESEDSASIEEELRKNPYLNVLQKSSNEEAYKKHFINERQYLDLLIYNLSGIILIFMMEQFIQIGMRLKSPY